MSCSPNSDTVRSDSWEYCNPDLEICTTAQKEAKIVELSRQLRQRKILNSNLSFQCRSWTTTAETYGRRIDDYKESTLNVRRQIEKLIDDDELVRSSFLEKFDSLRVSKIWDNSDEERVALGSSHSRSASDSSSSSDMDLMSERMIIRNRDERIRREECASGYRKGDSPLDEKKKGRGKRRVRGVHDDYSSGESDDEASSQLPPRPRPRGRQTSRSKGRRACGGNQGHYWMTKEERRASMRKALTRRHSVN